MGPAHGGPATTSWIPPLASATDAVQFGVVIDEVVIDEVVIDEVVIDEADVDLAGDIEASPGHVGWDCAHDCTEVRS